jgi:hypothetical protein
MQIFHNYLLAKNQPAHRNTRTQADSRIGESAFYDCFYGAVVSARAAVNANISVDNIHLVALRDSLYGAVVSASTALNASISDFVSHDFPSIKYVMCKPLGLQDYSNTNFPKCNRFFENAPYIFLFLREIFSKVG